MERNLQKGFAILLILCLLASGVEGHDLTVTPDIKAKFADCARVQPDSALYGTAWCQSTDYDDVVVCNTLVGMRSLGVCYDLRNEVYYLGNHLSNRPQLVYFAKHRLWYDRTENMYFDADTGLAYIPPKWGWGGHGVYVHLDAIAILEYQKYVSDAHASISEFQRKLNEFGFDVIRARVADDEPINVWALPWGRI